MNSGMTGISFGSGDVKLPGWIHVDWDASARPDIRADCGKPLPFTDGIADFLHAESFLETLPMERAEGFVSECHRLLRPGGVLRLLTLDLQRLVGMYWQKDPRLLTLWETFVGLPLRRRTLGEVLNEGIRRCGHEVVYDQDTLRNLMEPRGFRLVEVSYNESKHSALRGLDQRNQDNALSMYFDCERV